MELPVELQIQSRTLCAWLNTKLSPIKIEHLQKDLSNGVHLLSLLERLQKRKHTKKHSTPNNTKEALENVEIALQALTAENIKLVNITANDIVSGDLRSILSLLWQLVVRYELESATSPPKRLLLAWLDAALPELNITNFTRDWNSGLALAALVDFCQPGLFPAWRKLNPKYSAQNIRQAMLLAQEQFSIPSLVVPEDFSDPELDEKSTLCYLSFFFKEKGPVYRFISDWVSGILGPEGGSFKNLNSDWNSGILFVSLIDKLGATTVGGYRSLNSDPKFWEHNMILAIHSGKTLGVEPPCQLKAKHFIDPKIETIAVMTYLTRLLQVGRDRKSTFRVFGRNLNNVFVNKEAIFDLELLRDGIELECIRSEVHSASGKLVTSEITVNKFGGSGKFTPFEAGIHDLKIFYRDELAVLPLKINVQPDLGSVIFSGIEPCSVGSLVEVVINSNGAGSTDVNVVALSSTNRELPCQLIEKDGSLIANFIPDQIGEWRIAITYSNEHINGSPFPCLVYDSSKVIAYVPEMFQIARENYLSIDCRKAGWGELKLRLECCKTSQIIPLKIDERGDGLYNVSVVPEIIGKYFLFVTFNEQTIKDSPFLIYADTSILKALPVHSNVLPIQQLPLKNGNSKNHNSNGHDSNGKENMNSNKIAKNVRVFGEGLQLAQLGRIAFFELSGQIDLKLLALEIKDPSYKDVRFKVNQKTPGSFLVEFKPSTVGEHHIQILLDRVPVPGSPFKCLVFDVNRVKVFIPKDGCPAFQPVTYEIDSSESGFGAVEVFVNEGTVPCEVKPLSQGLLSASFVPQAAGQYFIEITLNGIPLPASPFKYEVSPGTVPKTIFNIETLENFKINEPIALDIHVTNGNFSKEDLSVEILDQNNVKIAHRIGKENDSFYKVYFRVPVVGNYNFNFFLKKSLIHSFVAKAYALDNIIISDIPYQSVVGQKCSFQVDASNAGEGQLEIAVNDGEVPNQVQVLGNGKCLISFVPELASPHIVDIKFNNENVIGCPFMCEVDEMPKLKYDLSLVELVQVGLVSTFKVVSNIILDSQMFVVKITSPSGGQIVPKLIYGKTTLVEFTVNEVGAHMIEFFFNNKPMLDKPIVIKSFDPAKVGVIPALSGKLNSPVQFIVDAVSAGEGNLEISVLNEQEKNVPTQVAPMGGAKFGVIFTPTTPNDHIVSITFNNVPVNDNPFIVSILPPTDQPVITGPALQCIAVDQLAKLIVHNVDVDAELMAKVQDGNNQVVPVNMIKDASNRCVHLEFSPRSPGEYRVQIKYRGEHVQKSPFTTKVYDIRKIKVKDVPMEIVVGKPVTFLVEATNAGPGNLEVIVNNGKVPSTPKSLGPSLYAITFVPVDHELHVVEIKFNGRNVENSPFKCSILDAEKVQVKRPEKVLINTIAQLTVETNGGLLTDESVIILGPSHSNLKPILHGDHLNGYQIQFNPTEVGDHAVDIKIAGISIPGCPFLVKVYDSKLVKVADINDGIVGKSVFFSIDASTAGAGNLEIIVSCNGRNVPNYVQSEGNAKFRVNFKPTEAFQHQISCKFNGDPVPGSPFLLHVSDSDSSLSSFIMDNVLKNVSVSKNIEFKIDNPGEKIKDCQMIITPPSGKKINAKVDKIDKSFGIQFKCTEVGPHQVMIILDGSSIAGSPFSCNVYDVNKIKVSGLGSGIVGTPYTFLVDASTAGEGTLELVVATKTSSVRAEVLMRSRGMYDVTFTPLEQTVHFLSMTFNEEEVPGTPMEINIKQAQPSEATGAFMGQPNSGTQFGLVEQLTVINFRSNCSNLQAIIVGPQKSKVSGTITRIDNDNYKLEFIPQDVGKHKIEILTPEKSIWAKPLILEVCDPGRIKIISPGICIRGKECEISIDTVQAGNGELSVKIIDSNSQEVPSIIEEVSSKIYLLKFTPVNDSTHQAEIFYNKLPVLDEPLVLTVQPQMESIIIYGKGLKCGSPKEKAIFFIETDELSANDFDIIVSEPNRSPLPVKCFQQKNGSLAVEWTPRVIGSHLIDVYHSGKPVIGSPFSCEVFDAKQVVIEPIESNNFVINKKINLKLLRINAGYAELDVTVTSPLGRHLPIEVNGMPDGDGELIEFVPTVPGKYRIAITFGGVEIPDSPLTFVAQESILPKVSGSGLFRGIVNEPAVFTIDAKDIYGSPEIKIDAPETETSFTIEKCNDIYKICYIPREVGVFDVTVLWNGQEISNSPYHPHIVDPEKVRVIGGWENVLEPENRFHICVGEEKKFSFDVSDSGPGKMSAKVKNLTTGVLEELSLDQTTSSKYKLTFSPKESGEYELLLYIESILLPRSPILAIVQDAGIDSGVSVVLRGNGLAGARVGEEAEFVIDGKDAGDGEPEVSLTGVKSDIRIRLSVLGTRLYKANYIAKIPGSYLLNVHWRGKQVSGCPLKVTILPSCDAKRVHCTGEGLKHGTIGKEIKAFIDTRRAGPGELSAHCVGPSKAAICELYDQNDGTFTLLLHPQEGGKHTLNIKYGGQHVVGSPFTLRVFTAPDASKVKVIGPGVEHGVLPIFQSHFVCDTKGAGAGQLTVRIRGPKGAFRVEMQRESQKDRAIHCKYDPTEPGDYRIEVKWAGDHVPGSPFNVMIFDTQDELNRFVRGNGHNGNSMNGSLASLPPLNAMERSNGYGTYTSEMNWKGSIPDL